MKDMIFSLVIFAFLIFLILLGITVSGYDMPVYIFVTLSISSVGLVLMAVSGYIKEK